MDVERLLDAHQSDFEVAREIKQEIQTYLKSLPYYFETDQGKNFLVRHTRNIDLIITNVYKYILRKQFQEYLPLINTIPITIVAMGSYGREQLCVYSDIDLLILYKELPGYNLREIIESFLQILWDSGLKLGHRVHEIETLPEAAESDHTIKTALLESRFIYGSQYLWTQYEHILNRIRMHTPLLYIQEKMQEREAKRRKYPFSMQPDIKNSPGGLRDANLLLWIARVRFNITRIRDLPTRLISDEEYKELMVSMEFLFRIRSALHLTAGRKHDKLIMGFVPDVGAKLGLDQTKTVQKTFEAMHHIDSISAIIIRRLTHTLFADMANIPPLRASRIAKNHYFCHQTHYGSLYERRRPLIDILETLLHYADEEVKCDTSFLSEMKFAPKKPLPKERLHPLLKSLFYKSHCGEVFKALYDAHQLFSVVAPLRKVAYLPQFDGYHTHPVDLHSIYTLQALESIDDPHIRAIWENLDETQKALLRLAAFLHDSGKGRKSDHSRLGARMIRKYAIELGFTPQEGDMVYKLILYHTLMSNTAHREDIYSEKVIFSFTAKIGTKEALELLYVLTYADIASVSKTAWTPNNAKLLHELYRNACEALNNRKILSEAARRNKKEAQLKKFPSFTMLTRTLQKRILSIDSTLFFLKYKPQQIIDIASWAATLESDFDYRITSAHTLTIEIIRKESVNLGYLLSKLSMLEVVNMDIFVLFNNIKYFHIEFDTPIEEDELDYIRQIVEETLIKEKKAKLQPLSIKPSEIKIDCNHSKSYARMQLITADQKGLMANIITIFDDIGIDIASAKIQTIKKKARNLFLIEKDGRFCTSQEIVVKRLISK